MRSPIIDNKCECCGRDYTSCEVPVYLCTDDCPSRNEARANYSTPYALRVAELEAEGLCTSDAQAAADAEELDD